MANPQAAPTADTTGFPVSRPIVGGSKVGSFFPVLNVTLGSNDVTIPIKLGRQPSGYIQVRTPVGGGQVTDGSNLGTDWTPSSIVLQATVSGNYSVLIF